MTARPSKRTTASSPAGRRRRWGAGSLAVVAVGGGLAWGPTPPRLPRVSDIWPLDLAQPGGWLVDRQIRDLRDDAALCKSVLAKPHVSASATEPQKVVKGCGWNNAVRVASVAGASVRIGVASCPLAAALALWMRHGVQPSARRHFGKEVASITHLGTYACRNIRGSEDEDDERSEHATANAVDVAAFTLAGGHRIVVRRHWGATGPEGAFLREVRQSACRYFRGVLGPEYDLAHRDHFHLDRGDSRICR